MTAKNIGHRGATRMRFVSRLVKYRYCSERASPATSFHKGCSESEDDMPALHLKAHHEWANVDPASKERAQYQQEL